MNTNVVVTCFDVFEKPLSSAPASQTHQFGSGELLTRELITELDSTAGILTYSSSKGAFIGASLNGAELQQDNHATRNWYGREVSFKDILQGNVQAPNAQARAFVNAVQNAKETAQAR